MAKVRVHFLFHYRFSGERVIFLTLQDNKIVLFLRSERYIEKM